VAVLGQGAIGSFGPISALAFVQQHVKVGIMKPTNRHRTPLMRVPITSRQVAVGRVKATSNAATALTMGVTVR